jgi:hypothetical protein
MMLSAMTEKPTFQLIRIRLAVCGHETVVTAPIPTRWFCAVCGTSRDVVVPEWWGYDG